MINFQSAIDELRRFKFGTRQRMLTLLFFSHFSKGLRAKQLADEERLARELGSQPAYFKPLVGGGSQEEEEVAGEREEDDYRDYCGDDDGDQNSKVANKRPHPFDGLGDDDDDDDEAFLESGTVPKLSTLATLYQVVSTINHTLVVICTSFYMLHGSISVADEPASWLRELKCHTPQIYFPQIIRNQYFLWFACLLSALHILWRLLIRTSWLSLKLDAVTFMLADERVLKMALQLTYSRAWFSMAPNKAAHLERIHQTLLCERGCNCYNKATSSGSRFVLRPNRTKLALMNLKEALKNYFLISMIILGTFYLVFVSSGLYVLFNQNSLLYKGCSITYSDVRWWIRAALSLQLSLVILIDHICSLIYPFLLAYVLIADLAVYWQFVKVKLNSVQAQLIAFIEQQHSTVDNESSALVCGCDFLHNSFRCCCSASGNLNYYLKPPTQTRLFQFQAKVSKRKPKISQPPHHQSKAKSAQNNSVIVNNDELDDDYCCCYQRDCNCSSPAAAAKFGPLSLMSLSATNLHKPRLTRNIAERENIERNMIELQSILGDFFAQLNEVTRYVSPVTGFAFFGWLSTCALFGMTGLHFRSTSESTALRVLQYGALAAISVISFRVLALNRTIKPAYRTLCTLMALDLSICKKDWLAILGFYTDKLYALRVGSRVFTVLNYLQVVAYSFTGAFFIENMRHMKH